MCKSLIIDDAEDWTEYIARQSRQLGYESEFCTDAEKAMSVFIETNPDLVLIDINLNSRTDSDSIIKKIRDHDEITKKKTYIFKMSSADQKLDKAYPYDVFAKKPIDLESVYLIYKYLRANNDQ